jgi:polysaccharide export outer membrane protein
VGAAVLLGLGCDGETVAPELPPPRNAARIELQPGDVLEIRVFGEDRLSGEYQLAEDGAFTFPFVGRVEAAGVSQGELGERLRLALANGWINDPSVTVLVKERANLQVTVLGQVQKPGTVAFSEGLTLVRAVSSAGGLAPLANGRKVRLTRETDAGAATVSINLSAIVDGRAADVPLAPGDIVFVPESAL